MATQIQLRRDTAANWTSNNTILAIGETGFETDELRIKVGDGVTAWTSLNYVSGYGTIPGFNGQIVFNDSGILGANSSFSYVTGGLQLTTPAFFADHTDVQIGASITFDFSEGNILETTLSADVTSITMNNTKPNGMYEIWVTQNQTTAYTFSGWGTYAWHTSDGNPQGVTTTLDGLTVYQLRVNSANTYISVQNGA